ncbi:hypothetical protein I4U23_027082 [Adineta vaga]|nr:hypothetical protein I4U23_027082 [Adineta vaga]
MILGFLYITGLSRNIGSDFYLTDLYLSYFVGLLIPYFCLISLAKLRRKFQGCLRIYHQKPNRIVPQMITMNRLNANRIIQMKQ